MSAVAIALGGCVTLGTNFDPAALQWLKPGETGKAEMMEKLGTPFRIGVDAGDPTWTYGYYRWRVLGSTDTKDLVIRWAADGKVKTFTLNTSIPEEKETLDPAVKRAE